MICINSKEFNKRYLLNCQRTNVCHLGKQLTIKRFDINVRRTKNEQGSSPLVWKPILGINRKLSTRIEAKSKSFFDVIRKSQPTTQNRSQPQGLPVSWTMPNLKGSPLHTPEVTSTAGRRVSYIYRVLQRANPANSNSFSK
jgi:hypothetical protein